MPRDPRVLIENDSEGGGAGALFAWSPDLPGCWSQGNSLDETIERIGEAIELYLAGLDREAILGGEALREPGPSFPAGADWTIGEAETALRAAGFARTHILGGHQLCIKERVRLVFPFGEGRLHPKISGLIARLVSA